ncbi:uncharacterized protein LTHEOB_3538 [Neofusicoccum parvum]|uniref:Uncharacterized protein LTHEOB_3538 n=1 Tax=Neofusicoccum parvum TaxID=310453 RepID=A0ACB5RNB0_9PEZI|nr:uncharacterized protein LTHEOB_3538 [Neofusicoccum parvum]
MTYDDVAKDDDDTDKALELGLGLGLGLGIPITSGGALAAAYALKMSAVLGKSAAAEVAELGVQALTEAGSLLQVASSHGVPASLAVDTAQAWLETLPQSAQAILQGEMSAVTQVFEQSAAGMASQFAAGGEAAITSLQAADGLLNTAADTLPAAVNQAMHAIKSVDAGIAQAWPEAVQMMQQMARMAEIKGVQVPAETVAALDEIMTVTSRSMARYIGRAELARVAESLDRLHNFEFDAPLEWVKQVDNMRPQLYKQTGALYEAVHAILNSKAVDLTPLRINAYRMSTGSLTVARDIVASNAAGAGSTVGSLFNALGKLFDPGHTVATNAGRWSDRVINSQRPAEFRSPQRTKLDKVRPHAEYYPDFTYDVDVQLRNALNSGSHFIDLYLVDLYLIDNHLIDVYLIQQQHNQPPANGTTFTITNPPQNLTLATASNGATVTITDPLQYLTLPTQTPAATTPTSQLTTAQTDRGSTYCAPATSDRDDDDVANAAAAFCAQLGGRVVADGAGVGGAGASVMAARGFAWTVDAEACEANMRQVVERCGGGGGKMVTEGVVFEVGAGGEEGGR